ncbi:MAG TPA: hypothetical protein VFL57_15035 [Bryobacteraceae bacterium]|nr:hypothetical protein [Bryobacteraceae bacterium]
MSDADRFSRRLLSSRSERTYLITLPSFGSRGVEVIEKPAEMLPSAGTLVRMRVLLAHVTAAE